MRRALQTVLALLPLLTGGCMTHKLWTESALDEWNEPAANPNLRLYQNEQRKDLLVVYDEYSERRETTRTRAFFLLQNQRQLLEHTHPRFVDVRAARDLPPVPVFYVTPIAPPQQLYAVAKTNSPEFDIYCSGQAAGSHELPTYNDGVGRAERVALTPVAATADAALIGSVVGCTWIYLMGSSEASENGSPQEPAKVPLLWWY